MYQHRWHKQPDHSDDQALTSNKFSNGKVVCVGRNYADHIAELNSTPARQPVLFLKPNSALCDATQAITVSHLEHLGSLHHELEIALLMGDKSTIIGIGLGIGLTLRDLQRELKADAQPWERSKSFDGSCPVSHFIPYDDSIDLEDIDLELILNGQVQQSSNSSMMLYSIDVLLKDISKVFTLEAGDIVLTGTPAGVGPLKKGDVISATLNQQRLIEQTKIL